MSRQFSLSRIEFLSSSFLVSTFIDPWGEDDPITHQIHESSFDEEESLNYWAFFTSNAPPDAVVLDVGAFAGLFSLVAVALRPGVKAVAFEASTVTFGRLISNILWNGFDLRVIPVNLAASNKLGFISFPHAFGIFSMSPGEMIAPVRQPDHSQTAATIPLDLMLEPPDRLPDYLNSRAIPFGPLNTIAALKIDVEGHELSVLEGSRNLLCNFRPPVICEALDSASVEALQNFFRGINYHTILVEHERNIVFVADENFSAVSGAYQAWRATFGAKLKLRASRILTYTAF
jgi:FkbM family methyltransferase